jgi:xylulokinase
MLFLGIDVGSSSVKVSVLDGSTGQSVASAQYPEAELEITSPQPGWAEQDPELWWDCVVQACRKLFSGQDIDPARIEAVGIAYQMHGLVLVDHSQRVLRPAIIWCDSRAAPIGEEAARALGEDYCFGNLLNSPGNFTAAKLRWVQQHEPDVFAGIHKAMLPGDFIAMKLTGEISTTASGMSEAILWDFPEQTIAHKLLNYWGISEDLIPELMPGLGEQGNVYARAAQELGIRAGVKITYRAGDQPNNAMALNVLKPGEVAATAGTSGVIYGLSNKPVADSQSRINTFLHPTSTPEQSCYGALVCVNGAGRSYSWLRQLLQTGNRAVVPYSLMNELAAAQNVGSDGLIFHPFGNGAERIFQNRTPGAQFTNIDLNRHSLGHMIRATQEGIVFALYQGFRVLQSLGDSCDVIRVARANMFLSEEFARAFSNTTQTTVELFSTDGAEGAARAAALSSGYYSSRAEAFEGLRRCGVIEPQADLVEQYLTAYHDWVETLPLSCGV